MLGLWKPGSRASAGKDKSMPAHRADDDGERTRRFRDAALPCLDDVYTLARHLLRDADAAEDAVQEWLSARAETFRQLSWPRNQTMAVRHPAQYLPCGVRPSHELTNRDRRNRRGRKSQEAAPLWHEAQASPEAELL